MKKWTVFACLFCLVVACTKPVENNQEDPDSGSETPVEEPVEEPEISLEHYDYYRTAKVARTVNRVTRENYETGLPYVTVDSTEITYNEEGLKIREEGFLDEKLTGRATYTYGDHSMHATVYHPGSTSYETDYTYEDAERTRTKEQISTIVGVDDYYAKTLYTWENGRMVLQEDYVHQGLYYDGELLSKTIAKTYTYRGVLGTVCTVTHTFPIFNQKDLERVELATTTYRDATRRQAEKTVVSYEIATENWEDLTPDSITLYFYNKDNVVIKSERYSGNNLVGVSGYTYKNNTRTVYTYSYYESQITETTFVGQHEYESLEGLIEASPFLTSSQ